MMIHHSVSKKQQVESSMIYGEECLCEDQGQSGGLFKLSDKTPRESHLSVGGEGSR
jgi:hypothetical protein